MRVSVVGTGYVGLVTGACLAEMGNDVVCVDVDAGKVEALSAGQLTIYEPGLESLVAAGVRGERLAFTSDMDRAVGHAAVLFVAVGTPPDEDGSADLSHVLAVARSIGERMTEPKIIVHKSTVPVGTGDRVRALIGDELRRRGIEVAFSVISNPEFQKEGSAVNDFMRPDRIVIGVEPGDPALDVMRAIYEPFVRNHDRLLVMDVRSAELTKYAANAMLATRISFMNELADVAERVGADIEAVRKGIGSDTRIGYSFLYAGCGYGGACLPKDVKALIRTGAEHGHQPAILQAVDEVNERQKRVLVGKVVDRYGEELQGRRFAIWGLAFKPNTDDMREAPSRALIDELLVRGATVRAYDPVAMDEARNLYAGEARVELAASALAACDGADALLIVTEWKEFRSPDFAALRSRLRQPVVFDGRNLYAPSVVAGEGIDYRAIGRLPAKPSRHPPGDD
jgi:UDPglucose 6-dehydrogenase